MGIKLVDLFIEYGPGEKERHQLVYSSAVKPIPEQTQGDPRTAAAHDKVFARTTVCQASIQIDLCQICIQ